MYSLKVWKILQSGCTLLLGISFVCKWSKLSLSKSVFTHTESIVLVNKNLDEEL